MIYSFRGVEVLYGHYFYFCCTEGQERNDKVQTVSRTEKTVICC